MFRAASLLIVFAVVANPAAQLLCDARCQATRASRAADTCHGADHEREQALLATIAVCERVNALDPFLTEITYRALSVFAGPFVATGVVASLLPLDLDHTGRAFLLRGDPGPPRPGGFVTVLRI